MSKDEKFAIAAATDGAIESIIVTNTGSGLTNGTYYAAVYGDGTSQGTSSGAIVKITVASNVISAVSTGNTGVHQAGAGYTFGTVNLGSGYTFSDSGLSSASNMGGSGGAIEVVISPKNGNGNSAIVELGGHYVMSATTLTQAENDDITTSNDFRQVGLVVDPTNYGTSTVATASTRRQTFVVKASSVSGTFEVDEKITQSSTGAVGKVVEFDSTNAIIYFVQSRHSNEGVDANGNQIAFSSNGQISGEGGTPPTATPDTGHSATTNNVVFNSGYSVPEIDHDSGDVLYVENRAPITRAADQTENIKLIIEF